MNTFNSTLISTIILGEKFEGDIQTLKDGIIKSGLTNTKLIDLNGKIY